MKKVLIVDDDTIVRITLRSLVDWGQYGFEVAGDASHGEQAFKWLLENHVDLLITDMKMPIMDGLQLMRKLNESNQQPCTLVLSSYDDFQMVREAFRLGAFDYLLKADISEEMLAAILDRLNQEHFKDIDVPEPEPEEDSREKQLVDMAMGRRALEPEFFTTDYYLVQFEIDDFLQQASRFGNEVETALVKPFLEFAKQIPRVAARCILSRISPSRYLMYYQVTDRNQAPENVVLTSRQLIQVWNNYMNIPVSAGISSLCGSVDGFLMGFEEAGRQLELHYLRGKASICYPWNKKQISPELAAASRRRYGQLIRGIKGSDELQVESEKQELFHRLQTMDPEAARGECLSVIWLIATELQETYDNIWALFQEDVDYYEKLERLDHIRSLEIWMNNYFRWVMDYLSNMSDDRQADIIIRAKRFIQDNYSNPELTLGSVAGYVGLNEKYFSSRFTKAVGNTFSNYLTEVRIRKARELMDKTDLKMYEIGQNVGYNSVEHFTRMFKKVCQISPSAYKKSEI